MTAVPASQHTAAVAEFRCLFTHDVRRKQKRWQDGFLTFHAFNNRVMAYDEARNFLGDTYYKHGDALHEGDALNLDKGVLIEVAEAVGVTQTDLTPLLAKKAASDAPPQPPRPSATSQVRPFNRPSVVAAGTGQRNASQLRHKSLNTLLGTPRGPLGKAQPMQSPFEARTAKEKDDIAERGPKRQKTAHAHSPSPWRASSPPRDESPIARKAAPPSRPIRNTPPPAPAPPSPTVILDESEPDLCPTTFSDVSLPSPPPRAAKARPKATPAPKSAITHPIPSVTSDHGPVQTPKIPRGKVPVPSVKAMETPRQPAPRSSPPVSASNRLVNVESAVRSLRLPSGEPKPPPPPPRNREAKSLRLSAGVKRGTLICQALPQNAPRTYSGPELTGVKSKARKPSRDAIKDLSAVVSDGGRSRSQKEPSRLSGEAGPLKGKRKVVASSVDGTSKRAKTTPAPSELLLDVSDDPELVHGMLDEPLLVLSSPASLQRLQEPPPTKHPKPKAASVRKSTSNEQALRERSASAGASIRTSSTESQSVGESRRKASSYDKVRARNQATPEITTTNIPLFEPPVAVSRDVSSTRSEASSTGSRTCSASPRKSALSTGGFSKKQHRSPKPTTTPEPGLASPKRRNETAAIPAHPLRSAKKGPLMSTTELAALLQKPPKHKIAAKDPIEDDTICNGKSPSRSFRRVRSENDAPIPSAADAWEKRNLPKGSSTLMDVMEPSIETSVPLAPIVVGEAAKKKSSGLSALIKKTDPRRQFKRTQSLVVETNLPPVVAAEELPSPVVDHDVGPWSTEAGDLFDWRPPGRD